MKSKGFGDLQEAEKILNTASEHYQKSLKND